MAEQARLLGERIQTAFRLGERDLLILDVIRQRYQLKSRVAALRWVLRYWQSKELEPR